MSPKQALEVACHALEYRSPAYSAHSVLARWQRVILISIAVLFLLGLIFLPWVTGVLLVAGSLGLMIILGRSPRNRKTNERKK